MELVTRILENTLNWVNAMMTATGYIWWGTIAACLVAYGVLLVMERIKALFKRRKDKTYYSHEYDKPIGKVVSVNNTTGGLTMEAMFFGPATGTKIQRDEDHNTSFSRIVRSEQYDTKDGSNFYSMNLDDIDRRLGNDGNS